MSRSSGIATDPEIGEPLEAQIRVNGIDASMQYDRDFGGGCFIERKTSGLKLRASGSAHQKANLISKLMMVSGDPPVNPRPACPDILKYGVR